LTKNDEQSVKHRPTVTIRGVQVFQNWLNRAAQETMIKEIRDVVARAPLFTPTTASGRQMSVQMTSAGQFGWVSDRAGYRYARWHPNGNAWPPIPPSVQNLWRQIVGGPRDPECCLINLYRDTAKMGLHQDRDEADFSHPVMSISLGDDGQFRIGQTTRGGATESLWLRSGDVVVMRGDARLVYHGIDKIRPGSSTLLTGGGRLNLTLRVAT